MNPLPPLVDLLSSKSQDPKLLSTSQASSYLTHLTTLPLQSLLSEPQTLNDEAGTLTSQLTNLCASEYSTFLSFHSTSSELSGQLESFSSSLESLLDSIPELEAEAHTFAESTKSIQSERRKASLVLEQHDKLLDVLQIPQLIDTCVRNGYYGEAMDLSAHAISLLARFPTIPIIIDVAAESEQAIKLMFSQLLALLREPAKLPALFKAVNFLRRMGSLEEEELALAFLTSRSVYLEGMFQGIETQRTDHTRYLKKYVDVFREGVYDVVIQYTSIFLDRATGTPDLHATLLHLLQTYANTHLSKLIELLGSTVPLIDDPTSLTSLLTQLTYCATSFARIGLDFRSTLQQPFTSAVLDAMTKSFARAAEEFVAQPDKNSQNSPSAWLITPSTLSSFPEQTLPSLEDAAAVHVPPSILSSYPPLATYTNSILTALNSLRLLAPLVLLSQLSALLEASLVKVGRCLLTRAMASNPQMAKKSENVEDLAFDAAGVVYYKCLLPFATRALQEGVYGAVKTKERVEGDELKAIKKEWETRLSYGGDDTQLESTE